MIATSCTPTMHAEAARAAFRAGTTKPLAWRRRQLAALDRMLVEHGEAIEAAVGADLGKPPLEAHLSEISPVRAEIELASTMLEAWTDPREVPMPAALGPGSASIVRQPRGTVLVIAPWNYPVQLLLSPLVAAIAAGNAVVVKPSELAPATSSLLARLLARCLDPQAIRAVEGGVVETSELLRLPWDHILYTGNGVVGRVVLEAAAAHLTPVTLELGGKSPVWVDASADVAAAASWIAWGRFLNAGQTCVAPDYVLTTPEVAPRLVDALRREVVALFGEEPRRSEDFGRIVSERHVDRLASLLDDAATVVVGGEVDRAHRYVAPTVLTDVQPSDRIMQEEIFGPILPIVEVDDLEAAIEVVGDRDSPLALYAFASDPAVEAALLERTASGALVVNAVVAHLGVPELPFGGVGGSGMGAYHGEHGVRTFSHERAMLRRDDVAAPMPELVRPPYTSAKSALLRGAGDEQGSDA